MAVSQWFLFLPIFVLFTLVLNLGLSKFHIGFCKAFIFSSKNLPQIFSTPTIVSVETIKWFPQVSVDLTFLGHVSFNGDYETDRNLFLKSLYISKSYHQIYYSDIHSCKLHQELPLSLTPWTRFWETCYEKHTGAAGINYKVTGRECNLKSSKFL